MSFEYLAYVLSQDEPVKSAPRVDRRLMRNVDNPFHLPHKEFQNLYRLSMENAEDLVYRLDSKLRGTRITSISTEKQVLAALRFFATGCYQRPVGEQWGICMSQSSISRCIHRVTDAINDTIFFEKIRFPTSQVERKAAEAIFASASSPFVPRTIGIIDCTHISILAPKTKEEAYINQDGYHSINVQMICDPNLKILNVNAKYPGSYHDSYIWSKSAARKSIKCSFDNGDQMFLIGDSDYPLEPWLMTPLVDQAKGSPEFRYNEALCKACNPIQQLFRVIRRTWRCLSQQRVLSYDPGFSEKIVNACSVLHNIHFNDENNRSENDILEPHASSDLTDESPSMEAKLIQDRLIANFFT